MITALNIGKGAKTFTNEQHTELVRCIYIYQESPDGSWLKDVPYNIYTYKWQPSFEGTDVMAGVPLLGDSIYVQPNGSNPTYWIQLIAPAIIHELRHKWQKKKYGTLVYSLLSVISKIPCLYEVAPLEKDAFDQQDKSSAYISTIRDM